jgi:hypothetical protein
VLYSQPIAALQILGLNGKLKWIKHMENTLVCINSSLSPQSIIVKYSPRLSTQATPWSSSPEGVTERRFTGAWFYPPWSDPSTTHVGRVVQPPADQRNHTRLGLFYFAMTDDVVKLVPLAESPVLQRVAVLRACDDTDAPTMEAWRRGRTSAYGKTQLKPSQEEGEGKVEEEVINGVVVRHYN